VPIMLTNSNLFLNHVPFLAIVVFIKAFHSWTSLGVMST
jgi:hypothetical protein